MSQRKANAVLYPLFMESLKAELTETESKMMVTRGCGWEKWGDICEKVRTSS